MNGVDTDVTTTQMTLMGILMVASALLTTGAMLLVLFKRKRRQSASLSKFEGEAH
jgi:hypothetical protein